MYVLQKIVCFAWGEKGREVFPQHRSNRLFEIKKKSGQCRHRHRQDRMIKKEKLSSVKERNEELEHLLNIDNQTQK